MPRRRLWPASSRSASAMTWPRQRTYPLRKLVRPATRPTSQHHDQLKLRLAALESAAAEAETASQQLEEDVDRLNDRADQVASVLTSAKEVHRCRAEQVTREQTLAKTGEPAQLRQQAEHLTRGLEAADAKFAGLEADHSEALARTGAAQGRLQQAEKRLKTLEDLSGEPTCSRCGQRITAEHLERERSEAVSEFEQATDQLEAAQAAAEELKSSLAETKKVVDDLDARLRRADKAAAAAKTARRELDRAAPPVKAAAQAATESSHGSADDPAHPPPIAGTPAARAAD